MLGSLTDQRVEADDSILAKNSLKAVGCLHPTEVLNSSHRLRQVPGDDHTVGCLLYIARSRHPRLQEDTNRRHGVDDGAGRLRQLVKAPDRKTATAPALGRILALAGSTGPPGDPVLPVEADRPGSAYGEGVPLPAGKRKFEVVQGYLGSIECRAELRVPLQWYVLNAISLPVGNKAQRVSHQIKEVGLPQRPFIQLHDDQVALSRNLADRPSGLLPPLGLRHALEQ